MSGRQRRSRPASGRFVLRLEPELHAGLRDAAEAQGLSLNAYCARQLALATTMGHTQARPTPAVERALALLGRHLIGVVGFGSWARGDAAIDSDIDVLIVVDGGTPIDRALYRRWDERPVRWADRDVDPHFVHLPRSPRSVSGLWAEVAREGIVLHERDLYVSRFLAGVRAWLMDGTVSRHTVNGQPFWMEEAAGAKS